MNSKRACVLLAGVAAVAIAIYAETSRVETKPDAVQASVDRGLKWLVSVQGQDGGWGQDGGETTYVRQGERLESTGNDVANTAVAASALLHSGSTPVSGPYRQSLERAVAFILRNVEQSPDGGLEVTTLKNTQIQRKLGPYIDTFLTSKLLAELDGTMATPQANARVRASLQKCVAKIEKNQLRDGSWNLAGGWAPILGTSLASQSLFLAKKKGAAVSEMAMTRVDEYTARTYTPSAGLTTGSGGGVAGGVVGGVAGGMPSAIARPMTADTSAAAGVPLYKRAQELEQLSRTKEERDKNAPRINAIKSELADSRFVTGFGSIGGEEFFSYLNISDSLHRAGGPEWAKWNADTKDKILKMQNEDGTWAGHHCITGRVAVTSAAILNLVADRDPLATPTSLKKTAGKSPSAKN